MRQFTELPPLGLYIHIPWCLKKCPYCDFNSHAIGEQELPENAYVDALLADLTQELPDIWGRSISSVFIGGGTPSVFSPAAFDRLLSGIRALTNLHPETEITMEANPGTFEQQRFAEFRRLGINRLSIGIQSFDDRSLRALGRVHNAEEATESVRIAREAGFERLNLDLMFGLPEQSRQMARTDLATALALQPDHLSWYQLTLEPNTLFYQQPPPLPDDDESWAMQAAGLDLLDDAGFARYEVSAFAQPRQPCRHNLNYWTFGDYLGIGAGAHGKISFASDGRIIRRRKRRNPADYLRHATTGARLSHEQEIPVQETAFEFMLNALRLKDGVETGLFARRTGLPLQVVRKQLDEAIEKGLLADDPAQIVTTALGYDHLNSVLEIFMDSGKSRTYIPIQPA